MARVVILLLTVIVVLNGLTFLVVVHLSPEPAAQASEPAADTTHPSSSKLDALARSVSGVSTDVKTLGRRMRDVDSKLQRLELQVKQVASRQAIISAAVQGPPANAGDREFPYSGTPEELGGVEEGEPLEPEEAPVEPEPMGGAEEGGGGDLGVEQGDGSN